MSAADGPCRPERHHSPFFSTDATPVVADVAVLGWTPSATPVATPAARMSHGGHLLTRAHYRRDRKRDARQKLAFRVGPAAVAATLLVGTGGLSGTSSVAAGTSPLTSQVVSMVDFSAAASTSLDTNVATNIAPSLSKNLNVALAGTSDVAAAVPDQAADALSDVAELADTTGSAVTESVAPPKVAKVETSGRDAQTSASRSGARSATSPSSTTSGGYVAPITGGTLTSGYGTRWGRLHSGLDFAAPIGHPLNAVGSGTITNGYSANGRGIYLDLLLDDGTLVSYGHMSSSLASDGQRVAAGDVIGLVGNTGRSTGPHVHFEVTLPGGSKINPQPWLAQQGLL